MAVAVQEIVLVGVAEGGVLPALARQLGDVAGARGLGGIEAPQVAGAGERREGGEIAEHVRRRHVRPQPLLGLAPQHLRLRPLRAFAQKSPGRGEVGVGLGGDAQDAPVDDAGEQRIAEIRHHRAGIGDAAFVDGFQGGSECRGFGIGQRFGHDNGGSTARLLGSAGQAHTEGEHQKEGGKCLFHATNRKQGLAASQWQVLEGQVPGGELGPSCPPCRGRGRGLG